MALQPAGETAAPAAVRRRGGCTADRQHKVTATAWPMSGTRAVCFICPQTLAPTEAGEPAVGCWDRQKRSCQPGGLLPPRRPRAAHLPGRWPKTAPCSGASVCQSQDSEEAIYTAKLLRAQTRNKSSRPLLASTSPCRASVLHYRECSLAHSKKY